MSTHHKYAIVSLCMLKEHYVIASCIFAFVNKFLISQTTKNIKLVIMCDDLIYEHWGDILKIYFDQVIKIKLVDYGLRENYFFAKKKYNWLQLSTNKWQCLCLEEYDKVLFVDVDILPVDISFYNIFDLNTPAFHQGYSPISDNLIPKKIDLMGVSFTSFLKTTVKSFGSIDGGLCLFTPSKTLYNEYLSLSNKIFKRGVYSIPNSGPDETSILYFFLRKGYTYIIDHLNTVIPWEASPQTCENAASYNFLSFVKPWLKGRAYQWDEEKIWSDLFEYMHPCVKLQSLYDECMLKQHKIFLHMSQTEQEKYYNKINFGKVSIKQLNSPKYKSDTYGLLNVKYLKHLLV